MRCKFRRQATGFLSTLLAGSVCVGSICLADETTLYATQDAFAWEPDMWTAHCDETSVFFGESDGESWVYWRWNILDNIPQGSDIQDVWIEVRQLGSQHTPHDIEARFYTIGDDWDECFPGWTVKPNTGDYLFTRTMQGLTGGNAWRTIDDASLVSFVQDVVDGLEEDNGLLMRPWNPTADHYQYYETKEGGYEAELHIVFEPGDPQVPDVWIKRIWTKPTAPKEGQQADLYVEFCNEGEAVAQDIEIIYYIDGNPDLVPHDFVAELLPGQCEVQGEIWTPDFCHDFEFTVEIVPVAGEVDVDDNIMTIPVSMDCASPPDISIKRIWTNPEIPGDGDLVELGVEFCNEGGSVANDLEIVYYVDGEPVAVDDDAQVVPGDCEEEAGFWIVDFCHDFEYTVEILPVDGEVDTDDNTMNMQVQMDCPNKCPLTLDVKNLVSGQSALWLLENGKPGAGFAVVWGTGGPPQTVKNVNGYCATFGFSGVNQSRVVGTGTFNDNGMGSVGKRVPSGLTGFHVIFQAAQRGTCPDECVSNLIDTVIQ